MGKVSMKGVIDMHVHTNPDLRHRAYDDFELADAAVLCVCASDRYGGGVRHCTKIFCAYFGAYRLKKERGEGI